MKDKPAFNHPGWFELEPDDYTSLADLIEVPFNNLFARMVIERKITGTVYVDELNEPGACLVWHPYGMLLLAGEPSESFKEALKEFMLNNGSPRTLWLQAWPDDWHRTLEEMLDVDYKYFDGCQSIGYQLKNGVVRFRRLNFEFDMERYLKMKKLSLPDGVQLTEIGQDIFNGYEGTVVAKYFWDDAGEFVSGGKGYALIEGNKIASASFSAFMIGNYLEIGIETAEEFRGKGYAEIACRALIDYALANGLEPVWSCRGDNTGSKNLAEKLGFVMCLDIPYYGLRMGNE